MLLRVDQKTRQLVPELATSWEVDTHERWIKFHLRPDVKAEDVVAAMVRLMDPKLNAGAGHPFRARTWPPRIDLAAPDTVFIGFDAPVPGLLRLFAQVSILRGDV
jgi:ABC-type transport system substrate-binding protein